MVKETRSKGHRDSPILYWHVWETDALTISNAQNQFDPKETIWRGER
jgi:hypothetical protein